MFACSGEAERPAARLGDRLRLAWVCRSYTLWIMGQRVEASTLAAKVQRIGEELGEA